MKKTIIAFSLLALLFSSCGTYTGQGAYVGAQFGTILGSAVGGLSGGWRGSDAGAIIGMASGAAVGAAIGAAADQREAERYEDYRRERAARRSERVARRSEPTSETPPPSDDSGYDSSNSGDDRVDFGISGPKDEQAATVPVGPMEKPSVPESADKTVSVSDLQRLRPAIEVRNVRIVDQREQGAIHAGEQCKVVFEIMNRSDHTLYDVLPMVNELTDNKHLHISPNLHIESIAPGTGVRYTATILADKRLKDGQAVLRVGVAHHNQEQESQSQQFMLVTRRK